MTSARLPEPQLDALRARRSAKWSMQDPDVIPLSIAEMDFDLAPPVREALSEAVARGDTGYAEICDVRSAFAEFADAQYGWSVATEDVRAVTDVGVGVVELLRAAEATRLVLSSPVYPPFFGWAQEAGAEVVDVPLRRTETGMRLDLDRLRTVFEDGGVYLLCNPQNPTGTVHSPQELSDLAAMASRTGVLIISDEIHAPVTFAPSRFTPLLAVPGADECAIALHSASKAWNLAGLKCALAVTAAERTRTISSRLPPDTRWRVGHFGALASIAAFRDGREWHHQLLETLALRRVELKELLADFLPGMKWIPGDATYTAWIDCSAYGTGREVADWCLSKGRVAVEPGERFHASSPHIRLNFATGHDVLREAVERMAGALVLRPQR